MATETMVQNQQLETISGPTMDYDVSVQKMSPKVDSLRILEPVRKKLASIEAERIISVVEKTIKKIEIITLIPHLFDNINRFSVALGLELVCAIKEHNRLEGHLDFAVGKLFEEDDPDVESQSTIRKVKLKEKQQDIKILQQAFGGSVKNILRLFQGNPSACEIIQTECRARSGICADLILALMELRDFVFERLLIMPTEEKEKFEYVQNIIKQDKKNIDIIATLEAELATAIQDKENEMLKKNEILRKLKNNLLQLDLFSEDYIRQVKQDAEKQQLTDQKDSEGRIAKYQEEMSQLRTQLNNLISEHRASEVALRKRKYKIETEIENWILKYDADLQEKQDEYQHIFKIHKEETILLFELEQKISMLEPEYSQIVEERKVKEEERQAKQQQTYLMGKAAVTIQSFWKGFKVRQLMKALKKKKKGKKKR
ncbi:dynein regulatory complex protein 10 [Scyliorhinus canicula]|uniref:dynein regulatory complex protein 10 n=1 Tax=Scyliorhinus canicula TaxID=7830 RepID=UPI0018F4F7AE|nr:dynein regulatory complex protein 10 [Scyliorhinus canicula]XP_038646449.1 dynein regulatory complex protein 10 [Scyliorhinus canicula]XP_038646456.1 dynein regulatory complex protein 10 [Scyliorhinus canicula]